MHSLPSNSGAWLPTSKVEYKPKLFEDPRNNESNKENIPPLESAQMPVLNVEEKDFLDLTEKLLGTDNRWEAHVAQQVPLPRTRSPCPSNHQLESLEQLETFTDNDMDVRDFSERSTNDIRPPKPPRKPKVTLQNLTLPPGCPDYIAMNHAVMGNPRPPLPEIRSFLPEKKKVPVRWPASLKRSSPKATCNNNDIYARTAESSENLYEEPHKNRTEEDQGPREKNMKVFL